METELKFEMDAAAAGALFKRLDLDAEGEARELRSIYFDTPGIELHADGMTLRIRDDGRKRIQTVKQSVNNGFRRGEWEAEVEGPGPDLKAAAGTPLSGAIGRRKARTLAPAFETRIERTTRDIRIDGALIEVALDRGVVEAGGTDQAILELELELKQGPPEALFVLARELAGVASLNLSFTAKAERGYALLRGQGLSPVHASDPVLDRRASAGEAFKSIAVTALAQIADNARVLRRVRRIEALHQARVGARRLRSAISLFKPMLKDGRLETVGTELKWLTHELDDARNLDVFITDTFRPASRRHAEWPGMATLGQALIHAQTEGYDRAVAALSSERFRTLTLETAAWIETGPWTTSDDPALAEPRERPIRKFAAEILAKRRKIIARRGRKLAELEPRPRHKLRIQAKTLRYACGFFAGLYGGKDGRLGGFRTAMEDLQDALGAAVDITAAETLAARLADDNAEIAYAAGLVGGERAARGDKALKVAEKALRRFKVAKPFW